MKESNITARIVDVFCVKPFDRATVAAAIKATGNLCLVVEDHYAQGGLYETVCGACGEESDFKIHSIAVNSIPRSGTPKDLLDFY